MTPELIVALDVPNLDAIRETIRMLPSRIRFYKVGLELFTSEGPAALSVLKEAHKHVFLDLKLHDIPRTVSRAVTAAAQHHVDMLTLHAGGGRAMLEAAAGAARAAAPHRPTLVAVTTLTSLDRDDLAELGVQRSVEEHTAALGDLALSSGIDGLVCSPLEVRAFRKTFGDAPVLVTPGVRPAQAPNGDQKRTATPAMAVKAGASFLVVGRSILQADDPTTAAEAILEEISAAALSSQSGD